MSKSYEEYVLGLFEALSKDIAQWDPGLRTDCMRDYKRILSGVEQMGIGFVADTLPAFGKIFDKALSDGRLTPTGLPHFRRFRKGTVIPRLFKGLLLRVFDINGDLLPTPEIQAIEYLRQYFRTGKDLRIACPDSRTYESVQEFFRTDAEIRNPYLNWYGHDLRSSDPSAFQPRDLVLYDLCDWSNFETNLGIKSFARHARQGIDCFDRLQRACDIVSTSFGAFTATDWQGRHGPGAVADMKGKVLHKYTFPSWSSRLEQSFPMADFAFANYGLWADAVHHESWCEQSFTDSNPSAHLLAVPKAYKGPRLIAAEPVSHQWCQQIMRDFFMTEIKKTPLRDMVHFRDQSHNGSLALEASHSGSHSTIDLSSASDRISCWLVERFFRLNFPILEALHSCRTQWIRQDLDKKSPQFAMLRKFSTMGSAVTFPIQSIIFATIAAAAVLIEEGLDVTYANMLGVGRRVRVFGDDIIVPEHATELTMDFLHSLGLRVNLSKTHVNGKFRESCGMDAYDGHNVTAVSVKRCPSKTEPESIVSAIDCHNNLYLKGLYNMASFVRNAVNKIRGYAIPNVRYDSGVLGWYSDDIELDNHHLKDRWNPSLCRREFRVSSLRSKSERIQTGTFQELLQYYTEKPWLSTLGKGDRLGSNSRVREKKLSLAWVPSFT
jgi:hypothetical protein